MSNMVRIKAVPAEASPEALAEVLVGVCQFDFSEVRDTVDGILVGRIKKIDAGSEANQTTLIKLLRGLAYQCEVVGASNATAPDFFEAGQEDGMTFDVSGMDDGDDDLMGLLEEESRKTGTNRVITADDLAVPATGIEVNDDQDKLLEEWNRTTKQRVITEKDLH